MAKKKVIRKPVSTESAKIKYIIENSIPLPNAAIRSSDEFIILTKMGVNQSVKFPPSVRNKFDYALNIHHEETTKRFIIRKIDNFNMRIFRIKDGILGKKLKTHRKKAVDS